MLLNTYTTMLRYDATIHLYCYAIILIFTYTALLLCYYTPYYYVTILLYSSTTTLAPVADHEGPAVDRVGERARSGGEVDL